MVGRAAEPSPGRPAHRLGASQYFRQTIKFDSLAHQAISGSSDFSRQRVRSAESSHVPGRQHDPSAAYGQASLMHYPYNARVSHCRFRASPPAPGSSLRGIHGQVCLTLIDTGLGLGPETVQSCHATAPNDHEAVRAWKSSRTRLRDLRAYHRVDCHSNTAQHGRRTQRPFLRRTKW